MDTSKFSILNYIPHEMDMKIKNPYLHRVLAIIGKARENGEDLVRRLLENREELVTDFAFSIPCYDILACMARYAPIVEIGAGSGYWAYCLSQMDVGVTAIDRFPPQEASPWELDAANRWYNDAWYHIDEGDERSAALYPDHSLLLSWPLLDDPMALGALKAYRDAGGTRLLFLGDAGLAGDRAFHDELKRHDVIERHHLAGWPGFHEELIVCSLDMFRI
ncbi:MAG: hypothetical protein CVV44_07145 [Spirochaetae bacterium HGW-Spirochaetae-1]|nr:MAG: hypothetical protein CVV44_07145 [Spirochaetae bacterium HGW-Spirochaetae-1]